MEEEVQVDLSTPRQPDRDVSDHAKRRKTSDRTSQACTKCRAQKMRCIGASDPPCRRCRLTGSQCEFVPRVNAARALSPVPYPTVSSISCSEPWRNQMASRVRALEEQNGKLEKLVDQLLQSRSGRAGQSEAPSTSDDRPSASPSNGFSSQQDFGGVMDAIDKLREDLPTGLAGKDAWEIDKVSALWQSFRTKMPGLHFFSGQVSFTHPTPLLAVSILYVASSHYPSAHLAELRPTYFEAFARAVGSLAMPVFGKTSDEVASRDKFDDVLGIILVGLLAIGWVDTVGMWVNTAYRLLLDGMAHEKGGRINEWRGLWEGLRTIELEHSSLHLICPALPTEPPSPPFPSSSNGTVTPNPPSAARPIGELLQIMQRRMARFVGRDLPTVWDTVSTATVPGPSSVQATEEDMAAIKAWAREIDSWYGLYCNQTATSDTYVRTILLLNYHLHKLFVLGIFLPLRGMGAVSTTERESLLQSSRLVLQIEATGFEVWSSWDLVIITNAALILLSAVVSGNHETQDLHLVQNHLNTLTNTRQPAPSLRHTLSSRLEKALQVMRTPPTQTARLSLIEQPAQQSFGMAAWQTQLAQPVPLLQQTPLSQTQLQQAVTSQPLFMDDTLAIPGVPDLQFQLDGSMDNNFEWPPFLLNMFGQDSTGLDGLTFD